MSRTIVFLLPLSLSIAAARPTLAQRPDEPVTQRLAEAFKKDYLSLGVLLQAVADFQIDRPAGPPNGFNIPNFRLLLSGELDGGFGYAFQANFVRSPAILDARMYYRVTPTLAVDVGQFKTPFSREFLTYAGSIDFVNRSQVVTALAPGRQLGAQMRLQNSARTVAVNAGVFNGNGTNVAGNDDDSFLSAARLSVLPLSQDGARWEIAVNAARSTDAAASFGSGFVRNFDGTRTLIGADARLTKGPVLLAGEVIRASLDPAVGADRTPWGFHGTTGYMVAEFAQLLVRWDGFDPDDGTGRSDMLVFGFNWWPSSATEVQINHVVNTRDAAFDRQQLLINFQFGF